MASLNKVFLLGNLTKEPDLRAFPNGQSVCDLRLAVSRRFTSNGQEQEETCFVDVVVWGRAANNCRQFLSKGSQVMVEGRLQLDTWEDRNGGGQRSRLRVVAENVQFMSRRREDGNAPAAGQYGQNSNYQNNGYNSGNYQQSAPAPQAPAPRYPADAPPMPAPDFGADNGNMPEDDIPF